DSLITMIFGVGAAVAAFPPVMDLCVSFLGRKGAVIAGGAIFCLGSGLQALVGIMLAFLLALVLEDVEKPYGGWIVPGLLLVFGGMVMPGSPQYLVAQGKPNEALKMLLKLRSQDVRVELAQILQEHEAESATHTSWGEVLSGDNLKLLGIGVSIQLLQQLCGMNAFMYDGPLIFNKLFGSEHAGRLFTLVS
ncbi:unnamed protein product, partial [Durusdinium trenchii]